MQVGPDHRREYVWCCSPRRETPAASMPPTPATLVAFLSQLWRPCFGAMMPAANQAPGVAGAPVVGFAGVTERTSSTGRLSMLSPQVSGGAAPVASASAPRTTKSPSSSRSTGCELKAFCTTAPATAGGTGTLRQNNEMITWRGPARVPMPSAPDRSTPVPRPRISPVFLTTAVNEVMPHGAPPGGTPATVFSTGAPAWLRKGCTPMAPSNLKRMLSFPFPWPNAVPAAMRPATAKRRLIFIRNAPDSFELKLCQTTVSNGSRDSGSPLTSNVVSRDVIMKTSYIAITAVLLSVSALAAADPGTQPSGKFYVGQEYHDSGIGFLIGAGLSFQINPRM